MSDEHIDRQPPRDADEEELQEELMREGAASAATEDPGPAASPDVDDRGA